MPCTVLDAGHPRACGGGGRVPVRDLRRRHGPSPRVRGRPVRHLDLTCTQPGHPRACGETWQTMIRAWPTGPSPRVRGRRLGSRPTMRSAGHPRTCGGDAMPVIDLRRRGPSPHVRGDATALSRRRRRRAIPARAGETLVRKVLILQNIHLSPLPHRANQAREHQAATPRPGGTDPVAQSHRKRCRIRDLKDARDVRDRD